MPKKLPMIISALLDEDGCVLDETIKTHLIEPKFNIKGDKYFFSGDSIIQDGVLIKDEKQKKRIHARLSHFADRI